MLSQTLKHHCEKSNDEFIQNLDKYFYVDNLILPIDSRTDLEKYYHVITDTLASANMPLSQWVTNDKSFNDTHSDDDQSDVCTLLGLKYQISTDSIFL